MPPRKASTKPKKVSLLKIDSSTSTSKRVKVFAPPKLVTPASTKGKHKATPPIYQDGQLWVDIYQPQTESDLCVHKRKVDEVRNWLLEAFHGGPNGKLKKYRRILALTGRSGTGKTATLRVLARELGFDIVEWRNSAGDDFDSSNYESLAEKFDSFLARASSCRPLTSTQKYQVILLEDLPNILHAATLDSFHSSLSSFLEAPPSCPLVIIVSDAGTRGEDQDENGWRNKANVIDIRTVLPSSIRESPFVTEIQFNPMAVTFLKRCLQAILNRHALSIGTSAPLFPKEALDVIIDSCHGDIRSAIMAMQFASMVKLPSGKSKKNINGMKGVLEAVTRREQSLLLFHLLGKVFYNKRAGDPPNPSATAKELEREKERESQLLDPPLLPPHLSQYARRASKVDVNSIYADSPVDTSLFSLYIHQNYSQFCEDIDQCEGIANWLSWIDNNEWQHPSIPSLPFHLLSLGAILALPSPVPRKSQHIIKPQFFENLKKTNVAEDAVDDVRDWLKRTSSFSWERQAIQLDVGSYLRALDRVDDGRPAPPAAHRHFTNLPFNLHSVSVGVKLMADNGDLIVGHEVPVTEGRRRKAIRPLQDSDEDDGCLHSDSIDSS